MTPPQSGQGMLRTVWMMETTPKSTLTPMMPQPAKSHAGFITRINVPASKPRLSPRATGTIRGAKRLLKSTVFVT